MFTIVVLSLYKSMYGLIQLLEVLSELLGQVLVEVADHLLQRLDYGLLVVLDHVLCEVAELPACPALLF